MKEFVLIAALIGTLLTLAHAADEDSQDVAAPPTSPAAKNAIAKAEEAESKALADYEETIAKIRRTLADELKGAKKKALESDDLNEAAAIGTYEKELLAELDATAEPTPKVNLSGTWDVWYANGVRRIYRFDRGRASYTEGSRKQVDIQLKVQRGAVLVGFPSEGKAERWTLCRDRAVVEHFFPAQDLAKGKFSTIGSAIRQP